MKDIKLPIITRKIINDTLLPSKVLEFHKKVHTGICIEAWTVFYLLRNHINSKYKKAIIENIVEVCKENIIYDKFTENALFNCFTKYDMEFDGFTFQRHLTDIFEWTKTKEDYSFWENIDENFWINNKIQNKLK